LESLHQEQQSALASANIEKLEAAAGIAFERVIADYPDVQHPPDTYSRGAIPGSVEASSSLGELAGQALFKLRHLAIGQVAPEIVREDCEGRPLRLKDYRGKIVVLCFSANWCGACVAQYPHYRTLVERLKDKPFTMLHVNGDTSVGSLKKSISTGKITWPCWWDGPNGNGPIAKAWHVETWPALYVLDADGVIRFRNVYGAELDQAVDALLGEVPQ
jgi:peroxiredoxin